MMYVFKQVRKKFLHNLYVFKICYYFDIILKKLFKNIFRDQQTELFTTLNI